MNDGGKFPAVLRFCAKGKNILRKRRILWYNRKNIRYGTPTMKKLVHEFQLTAAQEAEVQACAASLGITPTTARILYARGMDTAEKMRAFLRPGARHFLSPFLMKGMKEAVALLTQARDEGWRVALFGDYDADGIGALAVLSRALQMFGIEPYLYVPERVEGYGMSAAALDKIFDEFMPDLIVTVDCGISNAAEVAYAQESGAYVIVTDHHELPDILPDCVTVNPKFADDYPYDNLCGAGVAFKLATALIGDRAMELVDFAALSTVADSVPLLGENRDIVAEGLRRMEKHSRPAFSALLGKTNEVTAQTLAFTIAPRINAAGRMGDAHAALALFTTENEEAIAALAEKLNLYNAERQRACDELYAQALESVRREGAYQSVVMLAADNWNAGFVGIVAARIAEEFSRPALLFVRRGDMLRGSARSVEGVNIFEALKACSQYIEEFGGHSQAAGVNVRADKFEDLKRALGEYIGSHYSREDLAAKLYVVGEGEDHAQVAHELAMLEPFGIGNRRPLFTMETGSLDAHPVKPLSPHLSMSAGGLDLMYFGGAKDLKFLRSDLKKTLVFEYNLSVFRGREYLKGFVRAVLPAGGGIAAPEIFENTLLALRGAPVRADAATEELNGFLEQRCAACAYGLCAVCYDVATLAAFPALRALPADVFRLSSGNCENVVLVAPDPGCDLSGYRDVVFLDMPPANALQTGGARVRANGEISGRERLYALSTQREDLLAVFAALRAQGARVTGESYAEAAKSCDCLGFGTEEFIFALAVFEELGLIALDGGRLQLARGKKTELAASPLYTAVAALREA